ncbi:MAG: aldo/keto reductase, partial [Sphaerochaetaceae bacterium]
GISNYPAKLAQEAIDILDQLGTPCLIHQPKYSMFERTPEQGLLEVLEKNGVGCIPFSPLAQGLLTDKYIDGIPKGSRAARAHFLKPEQITEEILSVIKKLNDMAWKRGDTLAQMAINWILRDDRITSVLIGASKVKHITDAVDGLSSDPLTQEELRQIDTILSTTEPK